MIQYKIKAFLLLLFGVYFAIAFYGSKDVIPLVLALLFGYYGAVGLFGKYRGER